MSKVFSAQELFLADSFGQQQCQVCASHNCAVHDAMTLGVAPNSHSFLEPDQVNNVYWYHLTHTAQWHERALDNEAVVHLGMEETALARKEDVQDVYGQTYMYKVRLLDAFMDPNIYRDVPFDKEHPMPHSRYDGYRYLNEHETPGSISLFIRADAFEVEEYVRIG